MGEPGPTGRGPSAEEQQHWHSILMLRAWEWHAQVQCCQRSPTISWVGVEPALLCALLQVVVWVEGLTWCAQVCGGCSHKGRAAAETWVWDAHLHPALLATWQHDTAPLKAVLAAAAAAAALQVLQGGTPVHQGRRLGRGELEHEGRTHHTRAATSLLQAWRSGGAVMYR
jgi:hypothetical protein